MRTPLLYSVRLKLHKKYRKSHRAGEPLIVYLLQSNGDCFISGFDIATLNKGLRGSAFRIRNGDGGCMYGRKWEMK